MPDAVSHAKAYPFPVPGRSYLFRNGEVLDVASQGFDRAARTPVLAAGSNQSHEQLARKYRAFSGNIEIPVQRGVLLDFDSVYAAHFAGYGSIPSTFYPSPGTSVTTYILWLDDAQLQRMHETERNYTFDGLELIQVKIDGTFEQLDRAYIYSARVGCVNVDGSPVALKEIDAGGRIFPAMSQTQILNYARERCAPREDLDTFIRDLINNEGLRRLCAAELSNDALPLEFERTVLAEY